jgi:hypothetical protein
MSGLFLLLNPKPIPATMIVLDPRPERLSIGGGGLFLRDPLIRLRIAASSNADVLEPDDDRVDIRDHLDPYASPKASSCRTPARPDPRADWPDCLFWVLVV